jgi:serine/threonine-protein kinase RsbW
MAAYEALANAAEHAYHGNAIDTDTFDIDAAYDVGADTLTVIVEDHGQWQTRDPAAPVRLDRGRGIQLMYALAETASITTNPTGTRVCLVWTGLQLRD